MYVTDQLAACGHAFLVLLLAKIAQPAADKYFEIDLMWMSLSIKDVFSMKFFD